MLKVIFVGDKPSRLNIWPTTAFVGAKCFNTLVDWIKIIQPDYYVTFNSHSHIDMIGIQQLHYNEFKVIALGKTASKRLKRYGVYHYEMYHPSGLNRKLNDKKDVAKKLKECYRYIRGEQ